MYVVISDVRRVLFDSKLLRRRLDGNLDILTETSKQA